MKMEIYLSLDKKKIVILSIHPYYNILLYFIILYFIVVVFVLYFQNRDLNIMWEWKRRCLDEGICTQMMKLNRLNS